MPRRVLLIEADAMARDSIQRLLEENGLPVDAVASGRAGIARARAETPELILVDLRLPDVAGLQVVDELRREPALARTRFVALAGERGERAGALAAGWDGFVVHPVDPDTFPDQVKRYLAGSRDTPDSGECQRLAEELADSERRRTGFMHDLAHELSTPLTPLAGYVKILQSERIGALSPQQRKALDGMASAIAKLTRIVDNLADFANLEAGQAAISPTAIDPDELAEDVVDELRDSARDARLHVEVLASGGGALMADGRKLRQALSNVLHNAVKFSPHGGEILVEVARDQRNLRFSVYDQGPGVDAPARGRIFEPFQHADRRDEARPPGSGLGLPVARRIAEAHGGRILVESPPHTQPPARSHLYTGARFTIEIPAVPVAAASEPPARASGG